MTIIIIESHIKKKIHIMLNFLVHCTRYQQIIIYIKLMSFEFSKFNIKPNVKFSNVSF